MSQAHLLQILRLPATEEQATQSLCSGGLRPVWRLTYETTGLDSSPGLHIASPLYADWSCYWRQTLGLDISGKREGVWRQGPGPHPVFQPDGRETSRKIHFPTGPYGSFSCLSCQEPGFICLLQPVWKSTLQSLGPSTMLLASLGWL